jgi:hypothetical protein
MSQESLSGNHREAYQHYPSWVAQLYDQSSSTRLFRHLPVYVLQYSKSKNGLLCSLSVNLDCCCVVAYNLTIFFRSLNVTSA